MISRPRDSIGVRRWIVVAATAFAIAGGCKGNTEPSAELQGTYHLRLVNGDTVPYVYYHYPIVGGVVEYKVLDARVEFRTRHRLYDIRRLTYDVPIPDTLIAAYSVEGSRLLFARPATLTQPAHTDTGTIAGDQLTMRIRHLAGVENAYATFTYLRQP